MDMNFLIPNSTARTHMAKVHLCSRCLYTLPVHVHMPCQPTFNVQLVIIKPDRPRCSGWRCGATDKDLLILPEHLPECWCYIDHRPRIWRRTRSIVSEAYTSLKMSVIKKVSKPGSISGPITISDSTCRDWLLCRDRFSAQYGSLGVSECP